MRFLRPLQFTFVASQGEGGLLELVGVGVDSGTVLEEDLGNADVTGRRGLHQGRVAVLVVVLHVGAILEKEPHNSLVASGASVH